MSNKHNLNRGIASHGVWKQRLNTAIDTGKSEWNPKVIRQDNLCKFGKWLHSCSNEEKSSPHYNTVKSLHAEFHKEAANILELALSGEDQHAKRAMSFGSDYKKISATMTKKMMAWKQECQ